MSKKVLLGIVSLAMMFSLLGCSSGPTSPQKPWSSKMGELVWVEDAKIDYVYKVVIKTLEEMKFNVTKDNHDGLSGEIQAKTLTNKVVFIDLKAETADWTRVKIRVGFYWTNKDEARVIYERIKQNL
ncbi:MAG: DUF3568 family protein [Sedimentisphaerales bacterium]|nr:DUF3568 family protein [Sedimentisphaerales bacterium]